MLIKTSIAGALALATSLMFIFPLSSAVTVEVPKVVTGDLIPKMTALVGDIFVKSVTLEKRTKVTGTVQAKIAGSESPGEVTFIVFDSANYSRWQAGESFTALYKVTNTDRFEFAFVAGRSGVHNFVFDNRASLYKKEVSLAAGYEQTVLSREPDSRVRGVSYALLALGIPVLAYGLIRRPPIPWA